MFFIFKSDLSCINMLYVGLFTIHGFLFFSITFSFFSTILSYEKITNLPIYDSNFNININTFFKSVIHLFDTNFNCFYIDNDIISNNNYTLETTENFCSPFNKYNINMNISLIQKKFNNNNTNIPNLDSIYNIHDLIIKLKAESDYYFNKNYTNEINYPINIGDITSKDTIFFNNIKNLFHIVEENLYLKRFLTIFFITIILSFIYPIIMAFYICNNNKKLIKNNEEINIKKIELKNDNYFLLLFIFDLIIYLTLYFVIIFFSFKFQFNDEILNIYNSGFCDNINYPYIISILIFFSLTTPYYHLLSYDNNFLLNFKNKIISFKILYFIFQIICYIFILIHYNDNICENYFPLKMKDNYSYKFKLYNNIDNNNNNHFIKGVNITIVTKKWILISKEDNNFTDNYEIKYDYYLNDNYKYKNIFENNLLSKKDDIYNINIFIVLLFSFLIFINFKYIFLMLLKKYFIVFEKIPGYNFDRYIIFDIFIVISLIFSMIFYIYVQKISNI